MIVVAHAVVVVGDVESVYIHILAVLLEECWDRKSANKPEMRGWIFMRHVWPSSSQAPINVHDQCAPSLLPGLSAVIGSFAM